MIANNGSFNCNAGKILVTSSKWPERKQFLERVEHHLALPVGADERDRDFWRQDSFDITRVDDILRLDA